MSEPPLKHTAEQYDRLINICEGALEAAVNFWEKDEAFRAAEEAFLALEPSVATRKVEQLFEHLYGDPNKLRLIVKELRLLYNRAYLEESHERSRRYARG